MSPYKRLDTCTNDEQLHKVQNLETSAWISRERVLGILTWFQHEPKLFHLMKGSSVNLKILPCEILIILNWSYKGLVT